MSNSRHITDITENLLGEEYDFSIFEGEYGVYYFCYYKGQYLVVNGSLDNVRSVLVNTVFDKLFSSFETVTKQDVLDCYTDIETVCSLLWMYSE